jgi:hypothetical protein
VSGGNCETYEADDLDPEPVIRSQANILLSQVMSVPKVVVPIGSPVRVQIVISFGPDFASAIPVSSGDFTPQPP